MLQQHYMFDNNFVQLYDIDTKDGCTKTKYDLDNKQHIEINLVSKLYLEDEMKQILSFSKGT